MSDKNFRATPERHGALKTLTAIALAVALAACGGGKGTDNEAPVATSQTSATASHAIPTPALTDALMKQGAELNSAELARAAAEVASQKTSQAGTKAATTKASTSANLVTVYRFYNSQTKAHFYTASETEKANVLATLPQFSLDGAAFYASNASDTALSPVYRFYNTQTGVHFYTISEDERAMVQANLPQFSYDGVAYYASQVAGTQLTPLYRFYYGSKGFHFYSNSEAERNNIVANLPQYKLEGAGYYVMTANWGPSPLQSLPHSGTTDQQCYQAGSDTLVACSSAGSLALNPQQDGHRTTVNPMDYSEVPKASGGGNYARTECVKDNVTGLIWEGKPASGLRAGGNAYTNFDDPTQAQVYVPGGDLFPSQAQIDAPTNSVGFARQVNESALCGYSDWRLPSADELNGLVAFGTKQGPKIIEAWFPNTSERSHLSSTPSRETASFAFVTQFATGYTIYGFRNDSLFGSGNAGSSGAVRLVRGAIKPNLSCPTVATEARFTIQGDQVADKTTGLTWARCSSGQEGSTCSGNANSFTHEQALQLASSSAGWRLPSVKELASLADKGCLKPAIDPVAFPNTPWNVQGTWGFYWASTPVLFPDGTATQVPPQAWVVGFRQGAVNLSERATAASHVRLVRTR